MKPDDILGKNIGRIVTYDTVVQQRDCLYQRDVNAYEAMGDLLAAPKNMPDSFEQRSEWTKYRILIKKKYENPMQGILLGRTFKMIGRMWFQEDSGWIFDYEGDIPVVMIQPYNGSVRFRKPVAVADFDFYEKEGNKNDTERCALSAL